MNDKPVPVVTDLSAPYWEGAAAGELRVQQCGHCKALFLYAKSLCPKCWTANPGWIRVSGRGHIKTMTIVSQAPYEAFASNVPYVIAIIRLEEGPQLMANIVDCELSSLSIGQSVSVTFEKRGSIAIPQFRPSK